MTCEALLAVSEPWLQYAIRLQLCREPKNALEPLREQALQDVRIQSFLRDVADFHATPVTNHKNAALPIHELLFLLDIGLDAGVPEIRAAMDAILRHRDENGVYRSLICVSQHFGGSGRNEFGWSLCDAPLLLKAVFLAGEDPATAVLPGVRHLITLTRDNGFPCAVSPELGTFRGPGRKTDPCPYATLAMADLLSLLPQYHDSTAARTAVEALLTLWQNSRAEHPYLFYMGTDFRKPKAPPLWYDIVGVLNVLRRYPVARSDLRFGEMLALLRGKRDAGGMWTPESVYTKLRDWDFGQKKAPSPTLTFLCERILRDAQEA